AGPGRGRRPGRRRTPTRSWPCRPRTATTGRRCSGPTAGAAGCGATWTSASPRRPAPRGAGSPSRGSTATRPPWRTGPRPTPGTGPGVVGFAEPRVDGAAAAVEYWAQTYAGDRPTTISGCTVVRFDQTGLVAEARDYSHVKEGHHPPPADLSG